MKKTLYGCKPPLRISAKDWFAITIATAASWITLGAVAYSLLCLVRKIF